MAKKRLNNPSIQIAGLTAMILGGFYFAATRQASAPSVFAKIDLAGSILGYVSGAIGSALAIFGIVHRTRLKRMMARMNSEGFGESMPRIAATKRAMIVLFSNPTVPQWLIFHCRPEFVVYVYTSFSAQKCADFAREHQNAYSPLPWQSAEAISANVGMLGDAMDAQVVRAHVIGMIQKLTLQGLDASEIAVDCTGGTAVMSIGAYLAAEEEGVSAIYVRPTVGAKIEKPEDPTQGQVVYLRK